MRDVIESRVLRTETIDGSEFVITGYVVPDQDSSPDDADCYDEVSKIAFNLDEWRFVGLIVTVTANGYEVGETSLWAVEWGTFRYECVDPHTIIDTTAPGGRRTANVGETVTVELDPLGDRCYTNDLIHEAMAQACGNIDRMQRAFSDFYRFKMNVDQTIRPVSLVKATD